MKCSQTLRYCPQLSRHRDQIITESCITYYFHIQQHETLFNCLSVYLTSSDNTNLLRSDSSILFPSHHHQTYLSAYQHLKNLSLPNVTGNQIPKITCIDTFIHYYDHLLDDDGLKGDKLEIIVGCSNGLVSIFEENISDLLSKNNNVQSSKSYDIDNLIGGISLIKCFGEYIFIASHISKESALLIKAARKGDLFLRLSVDYDSTSSDKLPSLYDESTLSIVPTAIAVLNLLTTVSVSDTLQDKEASVATGVTVLKALFPSIVTNSIQYIDNSNTSKASSRYLVLLGDELGNVWWFLNPVIPNGATIIGDRSITEYLSWTAKLLDTFATSINNIILIDHQPSVSDHVLEKHAKSIRERECSYLDSFCGISIFEMDGHCSILGWFSEYKYNIELPLRTFHHKLLFPQKILMDSITQYNGTLLYLDNQGILYSNTVHELVRSSSTKADYVPINPGIETTIRGEGAFQLNQLSSTYGSRFIYFDAFLTVVSNSSTLNHGGECTTIPLSPRIVYIDLICSPFDLHHSQSFMITSKLVPSILVFIAFEDLGDLPADSSSVVMNKGIGSTLNTCLQSSFGRFNRHPYAMLPLNNNSVQSIKHTSINPIATIASSTNDHTFLIDEIQKYQQKQIDAHIEINELDEEILKISCALAQYDQLTSQNNSKLEAQNKIKLLYKFRSEVSNHHHHLDSSSASLPLSDKKFFVDVHIAALSLATMRALYQKHLLISFTNISSFAINAMNGSSNTVSIPMKWNVLTQPFEIKQELTTLGLVVPNVSQSDQPGKINKSNPLLQNTESIYIFDCSIPIKIESIAFHLLSISLINENDIILGNEDSAGVSNLVSCGSALYLLNKVLAAEEILPSYPLKHIAATFSTRDHNNNIISTESNQFNYEISIGAPTISSLDTSDIESSILIPDNSNNNNNRRMNSILQQSYMKTLSDIRHLQVLQFHPLQSIAATHSNANNLLQTKFGDNFPNTCNQQVSFNMGIKNHDYNRDNVHTTSMGKLNNRRNQKNKRSLNLNINSSPTVLETNLSSNGMRYNLESDSSELLAYINAAVKVKVLHEMQSSTDNIFDLNRSTICTTVKNQCASSDSPYIDTASHELQQVMSRCAYLMRKYEMCSECDPNIIISIEDQSQQDEKDINSDRNIATSSHQQKCSSSNHHPPPRDSADNDMRIFMNELQIASEKLWDSYCTIRGAI